MWLMNYEYSTVAIGALSALSGVLLQGLLASFSQSRIRRRERIRDWAPLLADLLRLGSAAARRSTESRQTDARTTSSSAELDDAMDRIRLQCPIELTNPANKYALVARRLLDGGVTPEELHIAEQELLLVYRRVSGIDKSLPWSLRGERARRDIVGPLR